jgi:hypothetical protein
MALKATYQATSDQACVVNVLGEFEPGETKDFTEEQVALFEAFHGYKLGSARFAPWFHLTVSFSEEGGES